MSVCLHHYQMFLSETQSAKPLPNILLRGIHPDLIRELGGYAHNRDFRVRMPSIIECWNFGARFPSDRKTFSILGLD